MGDRLWFILDYRPPAWDQADYLNWVLEYWRILQTPQWFSGEWWHHFWLMSPKIPPLVYVTTAPFLNLFGRSPDSSTLVMILYTALLLGSVYGLGAKLYHPRIGIWAALISLLLPGLYRYRLDFLLDYPLAAMVTFSFCCLTLWQFSASTARLRRWGLATLVGISIGCAFLTKQTAILFLFTPIALSGITSLYHRRWETLAQHFTGIAIATAIVYPWVKTNWLLMLTSGKHATVDAAIAEGDPPLHTLQAWIYYPKAIPEMVSWPLLLLPLIGVILWGWKHLSSKKRFRSLVGSPTLETETRHSCQASIPLHANTLWLLWFLLGAYFLCAININKDPRYILPCLPILAVFLAKGFCHWDLLVPQWASPIRWGTLGLAACLMFTHLYPLGVSYRSRLFPHYPLPPSGFSHAEVIAEIIQTEPYLRSNVGVLPSTPTLNQHNFNYYGQLHNFQVYARQVGVKAEYVVHDGRSLAWFITKTGEQGSVPSQAQQQLDQFIQNSGTFQLHRTWPLPDGSTLNLYHQTTPPVQVIPIKANQPLQLSNLFVSSPVPPGSPVPVMYQWQGKWQDLQSGLVLVTWYREPDGKVAWIHDHGLGMGNLYTGQSIDPNQTVQVTELTSMLPPPDLEPGNYRLEVKYLKNRAPETQAEVIPIPPITMTLSLQAPPQPAVELDLLTQFRTLAATLSQGSVALAQIFAEVGRINQYDPIQDYLWQVDRTLSDRLETTPDRVDWLYAVVLSRVLRQEVPGAIAALNRLIPLQPNNPYPYAYLAVVYLYNWQPQKAQKLLETALTLKPDEAELQALQAVALAMQGHFFKAWQFAENLL